MERLLKQFEQKLAQRSSRRSFFSKLGKTIAALAALTTGQAILGNSTAYADNIGHILRCCEGTACSNCKACPTSTIPFYTWSCLDSHDNQNYICTDCFQEIETTPYQIYKYICTFASHVPPGQAG